MSLIWTPQQDVVLRDCTRWVSAKRGEQVMYVAGFAGTGKSTLAKELVESSKRGWLYAAYSGKAALVMRQKGCHGARTIHSLIYRPAGERNSNSLRIVELEKKLQAAQSAEAAAIAAADPGPQYVAPDAPGPGLDFKKFSDRKRREMLARQSTEVMAATAEVMRLEKELESAKRDNKSQPAYQLWDESPMRDVDGVVIDECSMVDEQIGADLLSFGKKILVLGDPEQLPPVGGGGFFTSRKPDHMLTEVHRQARDSGILDLATYVREGGDVMSRAADRWRRDDCDIMMRGDAPGLKDRVLEADQVIVGLNRTRHAFNARHRELLGRATPWPEADDKVICLRNDREMGLLNGGMWRVCEAVRNEDSQTVGMVLREDGEEDRERTAVSCWEHHFVGRESALEEKGWARRHEQEFDYGFCVTTHKSQGSQWNDVIVFDESRSFKGSDMQRKWLYTAITRAAKRLTVVV